MSKTFETKRKILRMLSINSATLTEMSREFGLAPSTISKHLQDLEFDGAIQVIENPHLRKLKYYTIVPEPAYEIGDSMMVSKMKLAYPIRIKANFARSTGY